MPVDEARVALNRGKISLLVEESETPLYRFDPTRPDARTARIEADDALQVAAGRRDVFRASEEKVTQQGSRYIDFLMPGLVGMNLMSTGMWGMGFTIVNARMRKLLKRLVATPMRKGEYLLSFFLGRLFWLTLEVAILVGFGWLVFGVRVNGSIPLLILLCLVGGYGFSPGATSSRIARTVSSHAARKRSSTAPSY